MKKKLKYFLQSAAIVAGAGIVCASVISCTTNTNSNKTSNSNTNNNNNNTSQFSPTSNSLNLYTNASNGTESDSGVHGTAISSPAGNRMISITGNFVVNSATKKDYFGLLIAKSGLTYDSVSQMYEKVLATTDSNSNSLYEELFSSADVVYASGWANLYDTNPNTVTTNFVQINNSGSVTFNLLKALGTYQYSASTTYSLYLIGLNKNYSSIYYATSQDVISALPSLELFEQVANFNINLVTKTSWGQFNLSNNLQTLNINNIYNTSLTVEGNLELSNFNGGYYSFMLAASPSVLDYIWNFQNLSGYNITSNDFSAKINTSLSFSDSFLSGSLLSSIHKLYLILVVANSVQNLNDGNFELYQDVGQVILSN